MTARILWRVPATALANESLSEADLEGLIEKVADSGFHDGLVVAADSQLRGTVMLTALNKVGPLGACWSFLTGVL